MNESSPFAAFAYFVMENGSLTLPTCLELASTLFNDTSSNTLNLSSNTYPEALLQHNGTAVKYYHNLEASFPSFIHASKNSSSVLPWKSSRLHIKQNSVISKWSDSTPTPLPDRELTKTSISNTSHLFSWSSSDASIEERKKQLRVIRGAAASIPDRRIAAPIEEAQSASEPPLAVGSRELLDSARRPNTKPLSQLLNLVVDKEANQFIEDRVQATRVMRAEQALRELNERRLKDHELHLNKVRMKEAQDEREIFAATAESKNAGFFGSFFKFGSSSNTRDNNKFNTSFDDILAPDQHIPASPVVPNLFVAGTNKSAASIASLATRGENGPGGLIKDLEAVALDSTLDDDGFDDFMLASPEDELAAQKGEYNPALTESYPRSFTTGSDNKLMDLETRMSSGSPTHPEFNKNDDLQTSLQSPLNNEASSNMNLHIKSIVEPATHNEDNLLDL